MILVTGATGHFGKAAIRALVAKGVAAADIKALARKADPELEAIGVKTVRADYNDYNSLVKAFDGVKKMLFVSSSDATARTTQHHNVVNAAKEAGVQHIVYTSYQRRNETAESPLWIVGESHLQTEKWIRESGIAYTFLKNNLYMDFLPGFIGEKVLENETIYVPAGKGRVSAALRSEMAEAAALALATEGHEGKEYEITGAEAISYDEIAAYVSKASGKNIRYVSPTVEEYEQTLKGFGVPEEGVKIFAGFADAQAKGELDRESKDLEMLLGRKPVSAKEFLHGIYGR